MWRIGMWGKLQGGYYCRLDRFEEHLSGKRITGINATLIGDTVKARRAHVVTSDTIKADPLGGRLDRSQASPRFNGTGVSVRYGSDTHSKGMRREDLEWVAP
jgi:hypothetical protein